MNINFNFSILLLIVGTAHGLVTAIALLRSQNNKKADRYLGLLVLGFSLQSFDYFLFKSGIYLQHGKFYFLPIFYSLGFGPLLYMYIRTLTGMGDRQRLMWLHFLPVLIQCLFYLSLTFRSFPYKTYFWINIHQPYTQKAELYASVLSIGIYIYFSIVLLQKYNRKINDYFSNTAHSTLKWLRNMLLGLLILYAGWLTEHLLGNFQYGIVHVLLPIYIYWLAWMGFQQRNILDVRLEEPKNVFSTTKSQPEVSPAMLLLIKQAMENDRLYRNPTLTLSDLARHVDLAPKSVSFIINSQLGKSFNSYVNEYRIDDFKQKLLAEQNSRFTILALALESGFNSQASFYRIFKEFTGVSPKEYQKSLSNQS